MDLTNLGIADAGVIALLGDSVVFFGLILLMAVVVVIGKCFIALDKKHVVQEAVSAPAAVEVPKATAPGSAGDLKLYNVEPRTAAMLMAIVADKMGKPINELRFISVREVE